MCVHMLNGNPLLRSNASRLIDDDDNTMLVSTYVDTTRYIHYHMNVIIIQYICYQANVISGHVLGESDQKFPFLSIPE